MAPALAKSRAIERRVHRDLSEILAPTQKFGIDRADLVESFAQPVEVADQFGDLLAERHSAHNLCAGARQAD